MLKGVYLTLMMGPAVATPVSQDILDALTSVEVTSAGVGKSGFRLTFTLNNRSSLQTIFMLTGGSDIPIVRCIIVATINGTPNVLIDGMVTHHSIEPSTDPGHSKLTIVGEDLCALMNLIDFTGIPYPAMPPEARVAIILAKYAVFGVIPMVIPSIMIDVPIPTDQIPRQKGTDLHYIKQLADEVGYVFYINPGPSPGSSVAYWGPEIKVGAAQPALNINMDILTNVESLNFKFDTQQKTLPILVIQDQTTKIPIPIPLPDITPLNPPLGAVPLLPNRVMLLDGTTRLGPIRAALLGMSIASKSSDAIFGTGELDVLRYGRVLQPKQLVGVRGAGTAFDGLYYVRSVTHRLERGEYKQSFTLSRNGLVSTVSTVPA